MSCPMSMDGKGAWRDNVFVERLWRSVKYEEGYLHACDMVSIAAADPGCLNDRLRSTYRIGFCCPNKRGHLYPHINSFRAVSGSDLSH